MVSKHWRARLLAASLAIGTGALLAGCEDQLESGSGRSLRPIPKDTLAQMDKMGSSETAPILIRTYKKEAELQIWKMKSDGQYALLKSFPMCRWSGQLGPKTHEGDRQVPEGFYSITPAQMNPNSNYYLSFNVGYPNAYDRAFGYSGGNIMVHGACSSAGCYSMTDAQIAEIYSIAREAFNGGQREIQMQSYPFKMTAENLAKHRLDPNIDFWKQLKNGADHFEVTKTEPSVLVCGKRYVFGAQADGEVSPTAACPSLKTDSTVESAVAEKDAKDQTEVAELIAKGVKPVRLVYEDGGQNAAFAQSAAISNKYDISRPDALVAGPQEIALDEPGKTPTAVKVASAAAKAGKPAPAAKPASPANGEDKSFAVAATPAPVAAPVASPFGFVGSAASSGTSLVKNLFHGGEAPPAVQVFEPQQPIPSDVPLPPRRSASADAPVRMAALPARAKAPTDGDAAQQ